VYYAAVISLCSKKRTVFSLFAAIALLIRVAIPTGFMPSSMADGWYLELCPDGMPTQVMVALFGEHHLHHGDSDEKTFFQCDYDGGAAGALLLDDSVCSSPAVAASSTYTAENISPPANKPLFGFRSRAPPEVFRLV
jgi:hypothetical protein